MKNIKLLWTAFDLNLDCNRNCSFCCNREEPIKIHTKDTINLAVDLVKNLISKYGISIINIPILGGEPLLYPALPLHLKNQMDKLGPEVSAWMYTNGNYLTEDIIRIYKENRIWITLSAADSSTSYLLEKICLLKRFYRLPRLSITLSKQNLERLMEIVRLALQHQFTIRFRNLYVPDDKEIVEMYEEIVPEALRLYLSADFITKKNLLYTYEDILPGWTDRKSPYTCGRSHLHFQADGHIRSCSGNPKSSIIGNIADQNCDPLENLAKAVLEGKSGRWSAKTIKECQDCDVYEICQGGCPLTRCAFSGDFNSPTPYCLGMKKTLRIFKEKVEKLETGGIWYPCQKLSQNSID